MIVCRTILVSLVVGLTVIAGACEKKGTDRLEKRNVVSPGSQGQSEKVYSGLVDFIRKQKLVNYPSATIGKAFDSYSHLMRKEWKETPLKNGRATVDFTAWFEPAVLNNADHKDGAAGTGIDVTFMVEPDGSFYVFLISKIENGTDGKMHRTQALNIAGVLDKIYSNAKYSF
ncbi:MAG: hypothetical protein ACYC7L_13135 [Nitrospirota bacterium]